MAKKLTENRIMKIQLEIEEIGKMIEELEFESCETDTYVCAFATLKGIELQFDHLHRAIKVVSLPPDVIFDAKI
jgi:hypothetical protein